MSRWRKKSSLVEGEERITKFGRVYIIGRYFKEGNNYECIFPELTKLCSIKEIRAGQILHPEDRTVYRVGFTGLGVYNYLEHAECYRRWQAMIKRVHSDDPHYAKYKKEVSICEEWYNFQNFAKWFYKMGGEGLGHDLDKDLYYIDKPLREGKIYSPKTCHLLPSTINKKLSSFNYHQKHTIENGKFRVKIYLGGRSHELGRFNNKVNADIIKIRTFISTLQQGLNNNGVNYDINLEQILENYKDYCENR